MYETCSTCEHFSPDRDFPLIGTCSEKPACCVAASSVCNIGGGYQKQKSKKS